MKTKLANFKIVFATSPFAADHNEGISISLYKLSLYRYKKIAGLLITRCTRAWSPVLTGLYLGTGVVNSFTRAGESKMVKTQFPFSLEKVKSICASLLALVRVTQLLCLPSVCPNVFQHKSKKS